MIALPRQLRAPDMPRWPYTGARARVARPGSVLDGRAVLVGQSVYEGDPEFWYVVVQWEGTPISTIVALDELKRISD